MNDTSTERQYLTFKENRKKAFKFKLMINELPTLEKLNVITKRKKFYHIFGNVLKSIIS